MVRQLRRRRSGWFGRCRWGRRRGRFPGLLQRLQGSRFGLGVGHAGFTHFFGGHAIRDLSVGIIFARHQIVGCLGRRRRRHGRSFRFSRLQPGSLSLKYFPAMETGNFNGRNGIFFYPLAGSQQILGPQATNTHIGAARLMCRPFSGQYLSLG